MSNQADEKGAKQPVHLPACLPTCERGLDEQQVEEELCPSHQPQDTQRGKGSSEAREFKAGGGARSAKGEGLKERDISENSPSLAEEGPSSSLGSPTLSESSASLPKG